MIKWGISAASHNAALAVFNNDQLVFASESERFSGIKNDPDLCFRLLDYARQWGEPDEIYWYERPWIKTLRQLKAGQGFINNSPKRYLKQFGIKKRPTVTDHHHSHAAAGYYTSRFENACVVVIDAIGEFDTLTVWQAQAGKLTKVYAQTYPWSVGMWYSAMTQRVGLKPNEEEYILMGMAAYGDPDRLRSEIESDMVQLPNVEFLRNFHRGYRDWQPKLNSEQDHRDIAAAAQAVYQDIFEQILMMARRLCDSPNLVLMGGCALNCAANPLAFKHFDNVWIMPAPGDSGSAIGCVLAHSGKHIKWPGPYLGYDMDYHCLNEDIVRHLEQHQYCGVARGPAEFGPRALGNRSLLADPRDPQIRVLINHIKQRQQFRPFAPAILEEFANQVFFSPTKSMPYMQYICGFRENGSYLSVRHHDNTARVQTVGKEDDPMFRQLLEMWYERTGCPMLLNTSLNIKGHPMVNDHRHAAQWSAKYGVKVFN